MARKKLVKNRLKDLKKKSPSTKKRIQLKHNSSMSNLFDLRKTLYYSGFALTDNDQVILFYVDDDFVEKNNLTKQLKQFNLNEDDLNIRFDKDEPLKPNIISEGFQFENIGFVDQKKINWFTKHYPKCVFYPVTEWFGKSVNTLIIVVREKYGKAVAVVKTL